MSCLVLVLLLFRLFCVQAPPVKASNSALEILMFAWDACSEYYFTVLFLIFAGNALSNYGISHLVSSYYEWPRPLFEACIYDIDFNLPHTEISRASTPYKS